MAVSADVTTARHCLCRDTFVALAKAHPTLSHPHNNRWASAQETTYPNTLLEPMATSATHTSTTVSKEVPPVFGRTSSGGFKTGDGTLYVSKPFRSRTSKKLRAMVAFTPRTSAFDTSNERSGANEFRVRLPPLTSAHSL